MFLDRKPALPVQTGWVAGPHWCTVYEVRRMENTDV